jgi:arylsulfatase A-like enzyme
MKPQNLNGNLTRRDFLSLTATSAAAVLWPYRVYGRAGAGGLESDRLRRQRKLNLIAIMADDCSAGEIGCYGHQEHKTPNLDALARSGVMFKTCWCTPLCSPTRAEIMTGRYGFRTRWYHNSVKLPEPLTNRNRIFAQILKEAGYATAIAGKWQLPGTQKEYGFDESCIWAYENYLPEGVVHKGAYERPGKPARYWHPCILKNGQYLPTDPDDYGPDIYTDFLIDFMKRHKDGPFLLYYPMCLTHGPHYPTPDSVTAKANRMRNSRDNFKADVEYTDKLVGRIVKAMDELGLRENTVLFFTADNGTGGQGKGQAKEIGCRVPMIVNCPSVVKAIGPCDELVDFSDVLPTLVDLAAAELPKEYVIDGQSFACLLRGETYTGRKWIFSYLADKRMLRDKRWLLEGDGRFYDCGNSRDGAEYTDVTDSDAPSVIAARKRFAGILADKPAPGPDDPLMKRYQAGMRRKKRQRRTRRK